MKRLLLALVLGFACAVGVSAKPPVDKPGLGKERTPVERDLHAAEPPAAPESVPTLPPGRNPRPGRTADPVFGTLRAAVFQLGVVPLMTRPVW